MDDSSASPTGGSASLAAAMPAQHDAPATRAPWLALAAAYAALILYGSLFPLSGWNFPADVLAWLWRGAPSSSSRADNLANVLAYIPLGLALVPALGSRRRAVPVATLCGVTLSFCVETLQTALPGRIASITDLLTNSCGTLVGALLALLALRSLDTARTRGWVHAFRATSATRAGLLACALWALAHTFPFVPSIDVSNLRAGLAPVYQTLVGARPIEMQGVFAYALSSLAVGVVAVDVMRRSSWRFARVLLFFAIVLLLKVPIVGRQLSLEAIVGVGAACAVLPVTLRLPRNLRLGLAIGCVLLWLVVTQTAAEAGPTRPFNWIPFLAHLNRPLIGMVVMLEAAWPVVLVAYALRQSVDVAHASVVQWVGGVLVVATVLALEWVQQYIPGRIGDLTSPAIAAAVWTLAWRLMRETQPASRGADG